MLEQTQVIANIASAIALIVGAVGAWLALLSYRSSLHQKRLDITLAYVARWNALEFNQVRRKVWLFYQALEGIHPDKQVKRILKSNETRGNVNYILNYLDELGLAVNTGVVEWNFTYRYFKGIIVHYMDMFKAYVSERVSTSHDPLLWEDARNLYDKVCQHQRRTGLRVMQGKYWTL